MRVGEEKRTQSGEFFEVFQPRIRDLRFSEGEKYQAGESFQMFQPRVRDLRVVEEENVPVGKLTSERLNRGSGLVLSAAVLVDILGCKCFCLPKQMRFNLSFYLVHRLCPICLISRGSNREPCVSFNRVLFYTAASSVRMSDNTLGSSDPLFCSLAIPLKSLGVVLRDAFARPIRIRKGSLSNGISLFCPLFKSLYLF